MVNVIVTRMLVIVLIIMAIDFDVGDDDGNKGDEIDDSDDGNKDSLFDSDDEGEESNDGED